MRTYEPFLCRASARDAGTHPCRAITTSQSGSRPIVTTSRGQRHGPRSRRSSRITSDARRMRGRGSTFSSPSTSEAWQGTPPSSVGSVVERDLGRADQAPAAFGGVLADDLLQLGRPARSPPARNARRRSGRARTRNGSGPRPPRRPRVRPASISLRTRLASSTGWTPLRNVLANRPSTRPPSRRSNSRRIGTGQRSRRWVRPCASSRAILPVGLLRLLVAASAPLPL